MNKRNAFHNRAFLLLYSTAICCFAAEPSTPYMACSGPSLNNIEAQIRDSLAASRKPEEAWYVIRNLLCTPRQSPKATRFLKQHTPKKIVFQDFPAGYDAEAENATLVESSTHLVLANGTAIAPVHIDVNVDYIDIHYNTDIASPSALPSAERTYRLKFVNDGWMVVAIFDAWNTHVSTP